MLEALFAALLVSAASLVGILLIRAERSLLLTLVSFATGAFLGGFFLHVLPRVVGLGEAAYYLLLGSFVGFALLEKLLHFHEHFKKHSVGWINLVGDFFHNFLDGLGIAAAFQISDTLGWVFTLMVLFHEVPQELGDFAILVYSGFEKKKAIVLNFLSALSAVIGVVVGWFSGVDPRLLVTLVGGSMLYIAASDLVPLLREEVKERRELLTALVAFFLGIGFMVVVKLLKG